MDDRSNSNNNNNNLNNNNNGTKEYRSPRGPSYIGEKGFSHRSLDNKSSSDRKYNHMGSPPPPIHASNGRRNDRYINENNTKNQRREYLILKVCVCDVDH